MAPVSRTELDRIKNIRSVASVIASYKYIGTGRVKERSYANGTNLAVQYDGVKRVTDYTNFVGAATISQYQYTYDKMFNKLSEKRLHHGKRDDYVYDSLYRLTEYRKDGDLNGNSPAKTLGYTLDGVGNRSQVTENGTPTAYAVNNLNQYTTIGGVAQTYDDNGNLTNDGTRTFSYDYANRLVRIVTATQTIDYKYDVFGRRIEKSVDGAITRYYYEGSRTIEDRDGTDATTATYVYGNGIDEVLTMDRGGQTYYYHTNAQGSITEITDSTGAIVERYEYDAYGAITIFTSAGPDGIWQTADDVVSPDSAIGNRYTFTGREYEPESGLYYYRARFYDPTTGRFLQRDPIGNDMLGSLYVYVNNSPAVYVDSMGSEEESLNKEALKELAKSSADKMSEKIGDLFKADVTEIKKIELKSSTAVVTKESIVISYIGSKVSVKIDRALLKTSTVEITVTVEGKEHRILPKIGEALQLVGTGIAIIEAVEDINTITDKKFSANLLEAYGRVLGSSTTSSARVSLMQFYMLLQKPTEGLSSQYRGEITKMLALDAFESGPTVAEFVSTHKEEVEAMRAIIAETVKELRKEAEKK